MKSLCIAYIHKVLTHYRFLTTNSAGSEIVMMKSLYSDYIKAER